jgi:putative PEP-CTERM system TPR-repeat lipoprotein
MKMNYKQSILPIVISAILSVGITACGSEKTTEEHLISAKQFVASGKRSAAVIELKNAIKIDPNNTVARELLGNLYLKNGDGVLAEKELNKAYENGSTSAAISLLKAFKIQQKNEKILELSSKINLQSDSDQAVVEVYKALALYRLGKDKEAEESINNSIELSADSMYSKLGKAYLVTAQNREEAIDIINSLVEDYPNFTEALLLQGQLLFVSKKYDQAVIAFKKYQELQPRDISIQLMLANAYVKIEDYKKAEVYIDNVLSAAPENAFTNQLKGMVKYAENDFKTAKFHLDKAIQNGLQTPANQILAGIVAYKLKEFEQAYQYLSPLKDQLNKAHPALRILTMAELSLGYNDDASETLKQFDKISVPDTKLSVATSYALMQEGKDEEAKKIIDKLDATSLTDVSSIIKLGILKLSLKDMEGILELEKAVDVAPDNLQAKLSLAYAYIETKNFDKALKVVKNIKSEYPENILPYNIEGAIYLKKGETNNAKSSFEKVLSLEPDNVNALMFFVKQHIKAENLVEAFKFVEKVLLKQPENMNALALNYRIQKSQGDTNKAIVKLQQAFAENKSMQYRLLLASALISERKYSNVIELLTTIDDVEKQTLPNDYWTMLSVSYREAKKIDEAISTYERWLKVSPKLLSAWLQKINLQESERDIEGAIYSVNKAIIELPENSKLKIIKAHLLMINNDSTAANKLINLLSKAEQNIPFTQGIKGQVLFAQKQYQYALPLLINGYKASPNAKYATLIYLTYYAMKEQELGFDFLEDHLTSSPSDNRIRVLLADQYLAVKPLLAKEHYEIIVETTSKNVPALNNLAGLYLKDGNLKLANKYAMQAVRLAPNTPEVLDTIGEVKIYLGDKKEALYYLKKALELSNNNAQIKLNYDRALAM